MLIRSIKPILQTALKISPVVLLKGARQVGKSTLALENNTNYFVLDDVSVRVSASEDPNLFINALPKPVCIDEIQKLPQLLESIKLYIDKNRKNGDFLITGSANILDLKNTKDTLAGRIIELTLYPFSQKEKRGKYKDNVIDMLFENEFIVENIDIKEVIHDIISGSYPIMQTLDTPLEKKLWFSSYVSTYIERDARDLAEIRDIDSFFRFVNIIAPRSTGLLNKSDLSKEVGVRSETIENYITILEQTFQITLLRAYYENIGKQFVKSPKLFLNDSGIMCYFLKITNDNEFLNSMYKGAIFENFIFNELQKHISFAKNETNIYHYHTNDKKEIDFILQSGEKIVAIEVKSSSSINKSAFKHIIDFKNKSNKQILGIVFYLGDKILYFDEDLVALPVGFFY